MGRWLHVTSSVLLIVTACFGGPSDKPAYHVKPAHPRLFIGDVQELTQRLQVRFNPKGTLGGTLNGKPLATTVKTETQYQ
jgi:hypothetical protein